MVAIQFGQWAAVLVAMYLIHLSNADGLVTHDVGKRFIDAPRARGFYIRTGFEDLEALAKSFSTIALILLLAVLR
jgi:hypothetical protein